MKSILDKSFRYTPSAATDVRKTWAKARREQEAAKREAETALNRISRIPTKARA